MKFFQSVSLKPFNTFQVKAKAQFFVSFTNKEDISAFLRDEAGNYAGFPWLIIGQGSNILFTDNYKGLVIRPEIKGISIVKEDEEYVWVKASAGESWDDFVVFAVQHGFGGIENLSGIPGHVGACPIQNIGAYGQEVSETIWQVETLLIDNGKTKIFNADECKFGYRDSIFKHQYKNKVIITAVCFRLRKKPVFVLDYGNLEAKVTPYGDVNLQNIRRAVINIRQEKLPDVLSIGSAGSFFKNPLITNDQAHILQEKFPDMPLFETGADKKKVSAAWLIDQCKWRGYSYKGASVYEKQPLILVNYKNARGKDILALANMIKDAVKKKYGIELEPEVNIY
jgi:UDP-N-acetylmuramate dehydrogenase